CMRKLALLVVVLTSGLPLATTSQGQEAIREQPPEQLAAALPPVPQGVEVLARGPVHEAFATPTTDPVAAKPVLKAPPTALEELPPSEKPVGNATWIGGYWAWDDERHGFLWVSGRRRTGLARRWLRLDCRLLGARPARLRLGPGALPLDARRPCLRPRLLGPRPRGTRCVVCPHRGGYGGCRPEICLYAGICGSP